MLSKQTPLFTRVRLTARGLKHLATLPKINEDTRGVVVGYGRDRDMIYIRRDGYKTAERYHITLWEEDT